MSTALTTTADRKPNVAVGKSGLEFTSFDELVRFSMVVSASGLAPRDFQRPEACLVAIQMGLELGLSPMAALQGIAVVNGRPVVYGDTALAVVRASGLFDEAAFEETHNRQAQEASCTVRRLPNGKAVTRSFSMEDAKEAGLLGKGGPWKQYPRRMLQMRARSWALRDCFADILKGFRSKEEMEGVVIDVQANPAQTIPANTIAADLAALVPQATRITAAQAAEQEPAKIDQAHALEPDLAAGEVVDAEFTVEPDQAEDQPTPDHVQNCVADFRAQTDAVQSLEDLDQALAALEQAAPHAEILEKCRRIADHRREELAAAGRTRRKTPRGGGAVV